MAETNKKIEEIVSNKSKIDSEAKKAEAAQKIMGGGSFLLAFGLLGGLIGWIFNTLWSRADIGIGPSLYGVIASAVAIGGSLIWISAGFHQAISKYVSASLVTSKDKASRYASAGLFIMLCLGLLILIIFLILSFIFFSINFYFSIIFIAAGGSLFLSFIRDVYIGNLGGIQRFDLIAYVTFFLSSGIGIGIIGWLFFTPPINVIIMTIGVMFFGTLIQIILGQYYFKKHSTYEIHLLKHSNSEEKIELLKYGLYCAIPMLILNGTIYSIATIYYTFFLGANSSLVGIYGMVVGYASVMGSSVVFGWPQVPAISEAKEKKDAEMINHVVKNAFKTGFNFSAFLLTLYVSMAHALLWIFNGVEYIIGSIPLILHSFAVVFIGLDFLACAVLIGMGEGKKAGIIIAIMTLFQLISVPIIIPFIPQQYILMVGPSTLLFISAVLSPISLSYIFKRTTNKSRLYTDILWKGSLSSSLAIIISWIVQYFLLPVSGSFIIFLLNCAITLFIF
ncbi:MAG: hypothetical protein ACTSVY_12380, partial [Candidatus Helarchaeota archaeon]